jgi:hypothetical protein
MEQYDLSKKLVHHQSWDEKTSNLEQIMKWRESAFQAAVQKLQETQGDTETVMRTGEAFGRSLFTQQLKKQSAEWTIKKWVELTEEDVFKPLGTEFTFTRISEDGATTYLNRDPLKQFSKEKVAASLFTYGVMRGLFLSAFPRGELLFHDSSTTYPPEFIFKIHASAKDRFERERVKRVLSSSKTDDGA